MRFIQLVIFAILFPCLLLADGKYEITFFETKNVSKDYYSINLKAKGSDVKELCGLLKGDNDKKSLSFLIGDSASNIDSLSNTKSSTQARLTLMEKMNFTLTSTQTIKLTGRNM